MAASQEALVIGGGMAGLTAALELSRNHWRVTVLEARGRLGGRIFSQKSNGVDVELGAEFIHGKNEALWKLIKESQLKTAEVPDEQWFSKGPAKLEQKNLWGNMEKLFKKIDTHEPDQTFADFINRHALPEDLRQLAITFVEGFNAADHHKIGVHGLAAAEECSEKIEGDRSFRIAGG